MENSLSSAPYMDSAVVIPAYQPTANLIGLVQILSESGYVVLVVDDGSNPFDFSFWESLGRYAVVLHHSVNMGKGAALKTAFHFIRCSLPKVGCIVTMDADGQHLPQDMERVALRAWTHPDTLVLGTRAFNGKIPFRSRMGNIVTRVVFSCAAKTRLRDTQTGLRAFSRGLLEEMLSVSGERYEYEMNVLLHCARHKIPMEEVPIQTVYLDKKNTSSHFDTLRDSLRIYKNILRFASASLISFLADYLLFLILTILLPAGAVCLLVSNVLARMGSAALNYTLNTRVVFHDSRPVSETLPPYVLLAASILAANSLILSFFVDVTGIPAAIAKVITELILFISSFTVQSLVIFRNSAGKGDDHNAAHCPSHEDAAS
jgi:putative flippase GtrA